MPMDFGLYSNIELCIMILHRLRNIALSIFLLVTNLFGHHCSLNFVCLHFFCLESAHSFFYVFRLFFRFCNKINNYYMCELCSECNNVDTDFNSKVYWHRNARKCGLENCLSQQIGCDIHFNGRVVLVYWRFLHFGLATKCFLCA